MNKRCSFARHTLAVGFVTTLIACGKSIDSNAPGSRCSPGCTGSDVCEISYQRITLNNKCGSPPVECNLVDGSLPSCDPITFHACITGASCVAVPDCSPDDCNCILKAHCYDGNVWGNGSCWPTSSGAVDFYCAQS